MKRSFQYLVLSILVLVLSSCSERSADVGDQQPAINYALYIQGHTSGYQSIQNNVEIFLEQGMFPSDKKILAKAFSIEPSVKGEIIRVNEKYLVFNPESLDANTEYTVKFDMAVTMPTKDLGLEQYSFEFQTKRQSVSVSEGLIIPAKEEGSLFFDLEYTVNFNDFIAEEKVLDMFTALQDERGVKVNIKEGLSEYAFIVTVEKLERAVDEKISVVLNWSSKEIYDGEKQSLQKIFPPLNRFEISSIILNQGRNPNVKIHFSDPIHPDQDLIGMVQIPGFGAFTQSVENNVLTIYPKEPVLEDYELTITKGIKNSFNYLLKEDASYTISFKDIDPAVKIVNEGLYLPVSKGAKFVFQAVNLNKVDIRVIKIYKDNVKGFVQQNEFFSRYNLRQFGRKMFYTSYGLGEKVKRNKWQNFELDLSEIIKDDKYGVYRVEIGFRKSYAELACLEHEEGNTEAGVQGWEKVDEWEYDPIKEDKYWNGKASEYEPNYYGDYDYYDNDNPCEASYYGARRTADRLVTLAKVGLTVKQSEEALHIYTTDLITAKPMGNVKVELYNFQGKLVKTLRTSSQGMKKIPADGLYRTVVANSQGFKTYVQLENNKSLSLSNFETGGESLTSGIQAYLYADRGVWRPGDTVFLNGVIRDISQEKGLYNQPVVLEVYDPQGNQYLKRTILEHVGCIYDLAFATREVSPTGSWEAQVKVGNKVFRKALKIETIKPNRYKVNCGISEELLSTSEIVEGDLQINWLQGIPAANTKFDVELSLSATSTKFKGYEEYKFQNVFSNFTKTDQNWFNGETDADGLYKMSEEFPKIYDAPGFLKANIFIKAFEKGGGFSQANLQRKVSPYTAYVGVKKEELAKGAYHYETDKKIKFDIKSLNDKGENLANRKVKVEIFKISWSWWWDYRRNRRNSFNNRTFNSSVHNEIITTDASGNGGIDFELFYPQWGRYFVRVTDVEGGHVAGDAFYVDWPYGYDRSSRSNPQGAQILSLSTDKDVYNVGEKIQVSFPSEKGATALITLENGREVLKEYLVDTKEKETLFTIPSSSDMTPNVYVHVSLIQPYQKTKNDLPIRLYGVKPITVEDPASRLHPKLTIPESLEPNSSFNVEVTEEDGKEMYYTIAIVDEGLLDLTNFRTPNPWPTFHRKSALGVRTWDIFNQVIGAFGGEIDMNIAIGGDEGLDGAASKKEDKRFPPMVRTLGPFKLKKGAKANHKVNVPNYIGSVRAMIVASTPSAFGKMDKTVPVKKPIMVLGTLPRMARVGEEISFPVTVLVNEKGIGSCVIELVDHEGFELIGEAKQTLENLKPGEFMVKYALRALENVGPAKIRVEVHAAKEMAYHEIALKIQESNPIAYESETHVLGKGGDITLDLNGFGMVNSNELTIEFSENPPLGLEHRLKYLIQYPHGCLEQTTSSVFPQLYLENFKDMQPKRQERVEKNIMLGIDRLRQFQNMDGSMSYWPNGGYSNDWANAYAVHFLLEAKKKGYNVPSSFLNNCLNYLERRVSNWQANEQYRYREASQAYRLFVLALGERGNLGAMNRLRQTEKLTTSSKMFLVAAYSILGKKEAVDDLNNKVKNNGDYGRSYANFHSDLRNKALSLYAQSFTDAEPNYNLIKDIAKKLSSNSWYNTQATSFALLAMSRVYERGDGNLDLTVELNGESTTVTSSENYAKVTLLALEGTNKLTLNNAGNNRVYCQVVRSGMPPAGKEVALNDNISLSINYYDDEDNPIDVSKLAQNQDFYALVGIDDIHGYDGDYEHLALELLFASGWEIIKPDNPERDSRIEYMDYRDDRVYIYANMERDPRFLSVKVKLNAAYKGKFYQPALRGSSMYDNSIQSVVKGKWIEVE